MYRYTETIAGLTRTYEAESPEQVVALVLAVTIDVQSAIDVKIQTGAQLANVDIEELTQRVREGIETDLKEAIHEGCFDISPKR